MSTVSRLISGSAASWAKIGVTMAAQLALVPLYLSHWSIEIYGIWLAIQALVNVMSVPDFGHQTFLEFEFLRLGKDRRVELSRCLWSGISIGIGISAVQILLTLVLLRTDKLPAILGEKIPIDVTVLRDAGLIILLQSISWLICTSASGLLARALSLFGYYPRMTWWGLASSIVTTLAPVVAVVNGAGLLTTGVVVVVASVVCIVPQYIDMFQLLHKEKVEFSPPSLRLGFRNFYNSLALTGRTLLETIRQQGVRLVLSPLSGAAGMATFSTMRTGSNVALQGLNTIVNPLMPELMRFIHQRDKSRMEVAFGTVWVVLIALLAPGVVLLQAFIEPLFSVWTRGQIPFNPLLFALLSLSVLVYAVAQPAVAVVRGNNLLVPQLVLSALAAMVVVSGMYVLVPIIGILGAGVALLAAEIVATVGYEIVARRWVHENGLSWPRRPFSIAVMSILIATAAMSALIHLPGLEWIVLLIAATAFAGNLWCYWQILPSVATIQVKKIIIGLPIMKRIFVA